MIINGNKVYKDAECQHLAGHLFYRNYESIYGDYLSYDPEGNRPVPPEAITEEMFMTGIYVKNYVGHGSDENEICRAITYTYVENKRLDNDYTYTGPIMLCVTPGPFSGQDISVGSVYYYAVNCCSKYWPENNG